MKTLFKYLLILVASELSFAGHAQLPDVVLQSGNYDKDPYGAYNPTGNIKGTYSIQIAKSAHTFTSGQFTIHVAFPPGAVYAGGGTIPAEFSVLTGQDGSSAVVIGLTGTWSGTGPTAIRNFVLPIKIVAPSDDQPTGTSLQWLDPFVTENPASNSTGSPLNVDNVLPVKLVSFAAIGEGNTVLLKWATAEEINSGYFELQHSGDAKNWTDIARINALGQSMTRHDYSYTHTNPKNGLNYYRLKMVDTDLTVAFSGIEKVQMYDARSAEVKVYPNPVRSGTSLVIETGARAQVERIEMINSLGIRVHSVAAGSQHNAIPVGGSLSGVCTARVVYKDGTSTSHKVVVVK